MLCTVFKKTDAFCYCNLCSKRSKATEDCLVLVEVNLFFYYYYSSSVNSVAWNLEA